MDGDLTNVRHLIADNMALYGRLIDDKRFNELDQVFDDAIEMTVAGPSPFVLRGLDDVVQAMNLRLGPDAPCAVTHHNATNIYMRLEQEVITSRTNYLAWHKGRGSLEGATYFMAGHYDDRWIRAGDGLKVTHRIFHVQLTDGDERVIW